MLAFSPDGTKLATVQNDALLLWELRAQSPQIFRVLRVPDSRRRQESLASVIFQPKGRGIAAGSESGRILVWDSLATSQPRFVQATHPNVRLAYNRDGAKLLSASSEGDLRTFATKTLSTLSSQKHQAKTVSAIAPSSDGSSVAFAADGGLAVIDTASGKTTEVVPRPVAFTSLTAW
jgi:WD40 repeat protein